MHRLEKSSRRYWENQGRMLDDMRALANGWCAGAVLEFIQSISRVRPWRLSHKLSNHSARPARGKGTPALTSARAPMQ